MSMTLTELRADLYNAVDHVLETGEPLEIERKGRKLLIVPTPVEDKFASLIKRESSIIGDPEDIVHMDWSSEWNPTL